MLARFDQLRSAPGNGVACAVCDLAVRDETDVQRNRKIYWSVLTRDLD